MSKRRRAAAVKRQEDDRRARHNRRARRSLKSPPAIARRRLLAALRNPGPCPIPLGMSAKDAFRPWEELWITPPGPPPAGSPLEVSTRANIARAQAWVLAKQRAAQPMTAKERREAIRLSWLFKEKRRAGWERLKSSGLCRKLGGPLVLVPPDHPHAPHGTGEPFRVSAEPVPPGTYSNRPPWHPVWSQLERTDNPGAVQDPIAARVRAYAAELQERIHIDRHLVALIAGEPKEPAAAHGLCRPPLCDAFEKTTRHKRCVRCGWLESEHDRP